MNYFKILLLLISFFISGCIMQPAKTTDKNQKSSFIFLERDDIKEILIFSHVYLNLDPLSQKKKYEEIKQSSINNAKNTTLKIQLATMLTLPSSQMKDSTMATSLLQELINNKSLSESELAYVETLNVFTNESIRQQQQTKDELKKSEVLLQKNELLQKKHDALEKKLIDLKNIERKLIDRDIK